MEHRNGVSGERLARGIASFRKLSVLVVGDLFLDEYIESEMFEISKEGPIPVIRFLSRTQVAGAAGNLASTIRGLGAEVSMVALVGRDPNGQVLLDQLREKGIRTTGVLVDPRQATLTYTKIRARVPACPSKEILRMDVLPDGPLGREREDRVLAGVEKEIRRVDGVVVLDQIHHLITDHVLREIPRLARARGIPVQGSSRSRIGSFRGFDLITPNDAEALGAVGGRRERVLEAGQRLKRGGRHRQVILTLGPDGMALYPEKGPPARIPTFAREVVDVTGAGDCVSAVAALGNILGWDLPSIGFAASCAAAVVISKVGTYHLTAGDLGASIIMNASRVASAGEPEARSDDEAILWSRSLRVCGEQWRSRKRSEERAPAKRAAPRRAWRRVRSTRPEGSDAASGRRRRNPKGRAERS